MTPSARLNSSGNTFVLHGQALHQPCLLVWLVQHRPKASADRLLQRSLPGRSAPKDNRQAPRPRRDDMAHEHGGSHESACSRVGPEHAHARRLHGPAPAPSRHAAEQVPAVIHQEEEGHPQLACARRTRIWVSPQSEWTVRRPSDRTATGGIGPYNRPAGGWGSQGEVAVAELAEQVAAVTLGNTVKVTPYVTASTALRIRALCQGHAHTLWLCLVSAACTACVQHSRGPRARLWPRSSQRSSSAPGCRLAPGWPAPLLSFPLRPALAQPGCAQASCAPRAPTWLSAVALDALLLSSSPAWLVSARDAA